MYLVVRVHIKVFKTRIEKGEKNEFVSVKEDVVGKAWSEEARW